MEIEVPINLLNRATGRFGPRVWYKKMPHLERPGMGFRPVNSGAHGWVPPRHGTDFQVRKDPAIVVSAEYLRNKELAQRFGPLSQSGARIPGNLEWGDYRFWIGTRSVASKYARCRCCGMTCMSVQVRKEHMEKHKCTIIITRAYSLMHTDKLCFVCDKHSDHFMWGVPVHRGCMESFMFEGAFALNPNSQFQETVRCVIVTDPSINRPMHMAL